jgi:hypothetical protein
LRKYSKEKGCFFDEKETHLSGIYPIWALAGKSEGGWKAPDGTGRLTGEIMRKSFKPKPEWFEKL